MRCGVSFHLVPFLYDRIHPFPCETFQCILIVALMSRSSVPLASEKKKICPDVGGLAKRWQIFERDSHNAVTNSRAHGAASV